MIVNIGIWMVHIQKDVLCAIISEKLTFHAFINLSRPYNNMVNDLVELINKAKEAVNKANGLDEEQKKIAFQTILSELMRSDIKATEPQINKEIKAKPLVNGVGEDTIEELYNKMNPQGHFNTLMFFAYYFYKEGKTFTTSDVLEHYKKLFLTPPQNPKDILNKNLKKGFLTTSGSEKGRTIMQITRTGIKYVEDGFGRKE